jgi:protein-S-isoprenylcysteine O-methyltransferase Ste14
MANERPDTPGITVFPPTVYFGGLIVGYVIWWFWPVPIVPTEWSLPVRITGGLAFLVGVSLIWAATARFHHIGENPNPMEPTKALTFDGPYRYTRNPMYLGMSFILGGLAMLGNAFWPLLALIPVIWIIRTQVIAKEEQYLEARFGADYVAFKSRVRRWL